MHTLTEEERQQVRQILRTDSCPEPNSGCWLWLLGYDKDGYGRKRWKRKSYAAHRLSYLVFNGPIPNETPCVCHRCDNPICVNPYHLFLETHAGNMRDAASKGRFKQIGEKNNRAILTNETVRNIYRLSEQGYTQSEIAKLYGVSNQQVSKILSGKSWPHIHSEMIAKRVIAPDLQTKLPLFSDVDSGADTLSSDSSRPIAA